MRKALPSTLKVLLPRIDLAVAQWPLQIPHETVLRWLLQFDSNDFDLAVRILENLDVVGAVGVRDALRVAHTKLQRRAAEKGSPIERTNTIYAGVGAASKSGSLIAYHYRVTLGLPEADFVAEDDEKSLSLKNVENIVFVDDVVGTGRSIVKNLRSVVEEVHAAEITRNIFVLTVAGYQDGIEHVAEQIGATVVSALEYDTRDTVAALDAEFYAGLPVAERTSTLERLRAYCRSVSRSELGYGDLGGLLVFDHNTPNTSLPVLWSNGRGWFPLFPRAGRVPTAMKIQKSVEAERSNANNKAPHTPRRDEIEITLFVEGRIDEIFVDRLRARHALASRLGVRDVTAVALGGLYQSERLLELLRDAKKYAVFIVDDDGPTRSARRDERLDGVPVLQLEPFFISLFDFDRLYASERFWRLPDIVADRRDPKWLQAVEQATLKRGSVSASVERIVQTVDDFLDPIKCDGFVSRLKAKVDELFQSSTRNASASKPAQDK